MTFFLHNTPTYLETKEQVVIKGKEQGYVSDRTFDFLSHMSICGKHSARFLHKFKPVNEYKYMEKNAPGKVLFLHWPGLPR